MGAVYCHAPKSVTWSFTRKDLSVLTLQSKPKLRTPIPVGFFLSPEDLRIAEVLEVLHLFESVPNLQALVLGAYGVVSVSKDVIEVERTVELVEETVQVAFLYDVGS